MNNLRILRLKDVVQKTGLKKNTIYHRMRKGKFPKSFRIGGCAKTVGWLEGDVEEYIKNSAPWMWNVDEYIKNSASLDVEAP